mmetsp:Transcript_30921/g.103010  ORF Transcript_30921/g.103010 Transcript_30921/m.103010 type:complete len:428 (-) Transcript_30921:9360-10643(-)
MADVLCDAQDRRQGLGVSDLLAGQALGELLDGLQRDVQGDGDVLQEERHRLQSRLSVALQPRQHGVLVAVVLREQVLRQAQDDALALQPVPVDLVRPHLGAVVGHQFARQLLVDVQQQVQVEVRELAASDQVLGAVHGLRYRIQQADAIRHLPLLVPEPLVNLEEGDQLAALRAPQDELQDPRLRLARDAPRPLQVHRGEVREVILEEGRVQLGLDADVVEVADLELLLQGGHLLFLGQRLDDVPYAVDALRHKPARGEAALEWLGARLRVRAHLVVHGGLLLRRQHGLIVEARRQVRHQGGLGERQPEVALLLHEQQGEAAVAVEVRQEDREQGADENGDAVVQRRAEGARERQLVRGGGDGGEPVPIRAHGALQRLTGVLGRIPQNLQHPRLDHHDEFLVLQVAEDQLNLPLQVLLLPAVRVEQA